MRPAMLFLGMVIAMALVGAGVYGFLNDLKLWGFPLFMGLIAAGGIIDAVDVKP